MTLTLPAGAVVSETKQDGGEWFQTRWTQLQHDVWVCHTNAGRRFYRQPGDDASMTLTLPAGAVVSETKQDGGEWFQTRWTQLSQATGYGAAKEYEHEGYTHSAFTVLRDVNHSKVLVVQKKKKNHHGVCVWMLPGGIIDTPDKHTKFDLPPRDVNAAIRETWEESGFRITEAHL